MRQQSLFSMPERLAVINVASVPQRSPFRYPGGKTWLIPRIRQWIRSIDTKPELLVEPFVGGGIVSLTAVQENLVEKALMIELDVSVASVWKTILSDDVMWLSERIVKFNISQESVIDELSRTPESTRERAFQTILKNRTIHGGIMAPGSGLIKNGENGKGIRSRWYPDTLSKRIMEISRFKDRIQFLEGDGMDYFKDHEDNPRVIYFIDPPYTAGGKKAGSRLYTHCNLDHEALFRLTEPLSGSFLMTYDNAVEVAEMALHHGFDIEPIAMTNTHHAEMKELLIGRDLSWAR
jgi:DNA adenine methylase